MVANYSLQTGMIPMAECLHLPSGAYRTIMTFTLCSIWRRRGLILRYLLFKGRGGTRLWTRLYRPREISSNLEKKRRYLLASAMLRSRVLLSSSQADDDDQNRKYCKSWLLVRLLFSIQRLH